MILSFVRALISAFKARCELVPADELNRRHRGYTRIRGALSNLGHTVARSTIANILREHGIEPAPERSERTPWRTFLAAHWETVAATDFFTVEVATIRRLVTSSCPKTQTNSRSARRGRFDRHQAVASPRSGGRRRCRRFEFPVRAGKTPSSNGMPRSRAETWVQARAAPGPERASSLRRGSPGLDSRPSRDQSANKRRNHAGMVPADRRLIKLGARG